MYIFSPKHMVSKILKSLVTTIQATTFIMVYIMGPTIVHNPHLELWPGEVTLRKVVNRVR